MRRKLKVGLLTFMLERLVKPSAGARRGINRRWRRKPREGSRQRQKQKSRGALQLELQDRSDPSVGRSQHKEGYKWSSTGEGHM